MIMCSDITYKDFKDAFDFLEKKSNEADKEKVMLVYSELDYDRLVKQYGEKFWDLNKSEIVILPKI